jgi:hypothetical protein
MGHIDKMGVFVLRKMIFEGVGGCNRKDGLCLVEV